MSFNHSIAELVEKSDQGILSAAGWWERVPLAEVCEILNGFPFITDVSSLLFGASIIEMHLYCSC